MQQSLQCVLHPGFGKTGTSTLQEYLFAKHSEILSTARPYSSKSKQLAQELQKIEGISYNEKFVQTLLNDIIAEKLTPQSRCLVHSDENLTPNAYTRVTLARRLQRLFPEARVIFTIRHQFRVLESQYSNHARVLQDVPVPYHNRYVSFENWLNFSYQTWETSFLGLIDYAKTIKIYEDIFGAERVQVFLFEEMVGDLPAFVGRLSSFLGVDKNEAVSLLMGKKANPRDSARILRYMQFREKFLPGVSLRTFLPSGNSLMQQFSNYLTKGKSISVSLPDKWQAILHESYKKGNTELSLARNLPLKDYGYPL